MIINKEWIIDNYPHMIVNFSVCNRADFFALTIEWLIPVKWIYDAETLMANEMMGILVNLEMSNSSGIWTPVY
jgi:hypothetical protein